MLTIGISFAIGLGRYELLLAVILLFIPIDLAITYAFNKTLPVPLTEVGTTPGTSEGPPDSVLGRK